MNIKYCGRATEAVDWSKLTEVVSFDSSGHAAGLSQSVSIFQYLRCLFAMGFLQCYSLQAPCFRMRDSLLEPGRTDNAHMDDQGKLGTCQPAGVQMRS